MNRFILFDFTRHIFLYINCIHQTCISLQATDTPALHRSRRDNSVSSSSEAGSDLSDRPPLDLYTKEGELSDDQDATGVDQDQPLSQEQTYRETIRGIRSFMGWSHVPDIDSSANTSEDNPFAGPKTPVPGQVSVQMSTEDWLCKKLQKLNTTLVEGYSSSGSEAGGLVERCVPETCKVTVQVVRAVFRPQS